MPARALEQSWLLLLGLACTSAVTSSELPLGQAEFFDRRDPPPYLQLAPPQREIYELGRAIFNTQWVPAGTPKAARRDGLGPVFNAASCDACHNEGARAQGLIADGPAPVGLVIQLSNAASTGANEDRGDPAYGRVLNTNAIDGQTVEAAVFVRYTQRSGRYPDDKAWSLRVPHYQLTRLAHGALSRSSIIKPRIAPALFGVGLLQAVPAEAITQRANVTARAAWRTVSGTKTLGRFGWQADAVSIEDQTARAFAHEMGLSSRSGRTDDCSLRDRACIDAEPGGTREVSDDFMEAVVAFQNWIAVPVTAIDPAVEPAAALFTSSGCAACHVPELPIEQAKRSGSIRAYTDLLLHDLGKDLADRNAADKPMPSLWRTAPLWGLGYAIRSGRPLALLHDGRARTIEEALLWHGGEAASARSRFQHLSETQRQQLLAWLATR